MQWLQLVGLVTLVATLLVPRWPRVRRAYWRLTGSRRIPGRCVDCGKRQTNEEIRYYVSTCERCEAINFGAWDEL